MIKKLLLAGVALCFLAGCEHKHSAETDKYYSKDHRHLSDIQPGSQEDLVINIGDRVHFDKNRSNLSTEARKTLEKQVMWLKANPDVVVTIEGHCDQRGTRNYNLALGERRAEAVKKFMVAHGIDPTRVYTISYGKERPEFMGNNKTVWAKNRRAVTTVMD